MANAMGVPPTSLPTDAVFPLGSMLVEGKGFISLIHSVAYVRLQSPGEIRTLQVDSWV